MSNLKPTQPRKVTHKCSQDDKKHKVTVDKKGCYLSASLTRSLPVMLGECNVRCVTDAMGYIDTVKLLLYAPGMAPESRAFELKPHNNGRAYRLNSTWLAEAVFSVTGGYRKPLSCPARYDEKTKTITFKVKGDFSDD